MEPETVKIAAPKTDDNPQGFVVINKADFNPDEQELYVDPDAPPAKVKPAKPKD